MAALPEELRDDGCSRAETLLDRQQLDRLMPAIYDELRRLATQQLRGERADHTLQTTDLAHEVYLRLARQHRVDWANRAQVLGVAARAMRRILIDHARRRAAKKRPGNRVFVATDQLESLANKQPVDLLLLDDALNRLERLDELQAKIVELRFFGGLTIRELTGQLGTSAATIKREWAMAKAWLFRELSEADDRGC